MAKNKLIEFAFIMLQEDFLQKIMMIAIMDRFSGLWHSCPSLAAFKSAKDKNKGKTSFKGL